MSNKGDKGFFISEGKATDGGKDRNGFRNSPWQPVSRWGVSFGKMFSVRGFVITFFCKTEAQRNSSVGAGPVAVAPLPIPKGKALCIMTIVVI